MKKSETSPAVQGFCYSFLAFGLALVYWWRLVRNRWWPDGDEFALFANSAYMFHPHPAQWFFRGYRGYLGVYPQLSVSLSNFIRPVANITYYLASYIYGVHWDRYVITNYFVLSVVVGLTVALGARYFGFSKWQNACIALLLFFIPSHDMLTTLYPNCDLDMIASTFVLLTVLCLFSSHFMLGVLCVTVAVFCKETAYFTPFAAIFALLMLRDFKFDRTFRLYSVLFPLPLIAVYVCRAIAFNGSTMGGVYVFAGESSFVHRLGTAVRGLMTWPLHRYTWDVNGLTGYSHHPVITWVLRGICICFWLTLAATVVALARIRNTAVTGRLSLVVRQQSYLLTAILFLSGALALPLALDLSSRFGAIAFPFLVIVCFGAFRTLYGRPFLRVIWLLIACLFFMLSIMARIHVHREVVALAPQWEMNHSLLKQAKVAPPGVLLIVDDMTGFDASTQWFQAFSGFQGQVIRVNDFLQSGPTDCPQLSSIARQSPTVLKVTFASSSVCGKAVLRAISIPVPQQWHRTVGGVSIDYLADPHGMIQSAIIHLPADQEVTVLQGDVATHKYIQPQIPNKG